MTGSEPVAVMMTGWTEPMVVAGVIAARSVAMRIIVPALAALAPLGWTYPIMGMSTSVRISSVISSVSASPPPGVLRRRIMASAWSRLAMSRTSLKCSKVAKVMVPSMSAWITSWLPTCA